MSQMQPPIPNPDDWERRRQIDDWGRQWQKMPEPPADPETPSFPYKGADGNLYNDERDARATHDVPTGHPSGWMLAYSMFEAPHYIFIGPYGDGEASQP